MQNLLPIVTIAHRCENSGTNRLNPATGKITAMQSGSSAFVKKVLIGKETQPAPLTTSLGCLRRQGEAEKLRFRLISYFGRHRAGLDGPFETIG